MSEKILKIEESYFKYEEIYSMEGFKVTTDKQEILVGISSYQSCCENFGYFMTNDNIDDFVGASLNSVRITDDLLKVEDFDKPVAAIIYNGFTYSLFRTSFDWTEVQKITNRLSTAYVITIISKGWAIWTFEY